MRLKLMTYDLNVCYVPGQQMLVADHLSRSFLQDNEGGENDFTGVCHSINVSDQVKLQFIEETLKDAAYTI